MAGDSSISEHLRQVMAAVLQQPDEEATLSILRDATNLRDNELYDALTELTNREWLTRMRYPNRQLGDPLWLWKMTSLGYQERPRWQFSSPPPLRGRSSLPNNASRNYFLLGTLLLAVVLGLIQVRNYFVYQSYQQGTCTILSGWMTGNTNRGGSIVSYSPDFRYIVHTTNGQTARSGGYDAPTQQTYSQDQAQQIVSGYAAGHSYPCQYNPADPTHAVLILYGEPIGNLLLGYGLTAGVSWLALLFFGGILYSMIFAIATDRGTARAGGCSLVFIALFCLICLAALVGGAVILALIWQSA